MTRIGEALILTVLAGLCSAGQLRSRATGSLVANTTAPSQMPCQCKAASPSWVASKRTVPKCIFLDLGAADGNTLKDFVAGRYGPVRQCPSGGKWEATLVEANPRFDTSLTVMQGTYPGMVHPLSSHAAYMCEADTSFYLDTKNTTITVGDTKKSTNFWGSSMSENHVDAKASGLVKVTVPTVNVNRLLYENTIPGDFVLLKMDVEGAEWDILPCMAQASSTSLVDRLLVEIHPKEWSKAGTTSKQMEESMAVIRGKGVDVPSAYHSHTM